MLGGFNFSCNLYKSKNLYKYNIYVNEEQKLKEAEETIHRLKIKFDSVMLEAFTNNPWLLDFKNDFNLLDVEIKRLINIGNVYIKHCSNSPRTTYDIHSLSFALICRVYLFLQRYSENVFKSKDEEIIDEFNKNFKLPIVFWNMEKHYNFEQKIKVKNVNLWQQHIDSKAINLNLDCKNINDFKILLEKWDWTIQKELIEFWKKESKENKYCFEEIKFLPINSKRKFMGQLKEIPYYFNYLAVYKDLLKTLETIGSDLKLKKFAETLTRRDWRTLMMSSWHKFIKKMNDMLDTIWTFFINSTKLRKHIKRKRKNSRGS